MIQLSKIEGSAMLTQTKLNSVKTRKIVKVKYCQAGSTLAKLNLKVISVG